MDSTIVTNREARRDYNILWSLEAGIQLKGCEVKSLRAHRANLKGSFAHLDKNSNLLLYNMHITPYEQAGVQAEDADRPRQLLLHKSQIIRISAELNQKGLAVIPLKVYFKGSMVKVELGVGKGKHSYDKREDIKKREDERKMQRAVRKKVS